MRKEFDVIIMGSGLSGTVLGAILARHGHRVLMIDSNSHPRFAVGESTVPEMTLTLELMAKRYDVPELAHLCSPDVLLKHVGSTSGMKKGFSFIYYRDGEPQSFIKTRIPCCENHYFRQDTDAYLFYAAIRYGAEALQQENVTDFQFTDDHVRVTTARGQTFQARYLLDCTGYASPLAKQLKLREEPTRMKHHSRTVFTHMVDVAPFEKCLDIPAERIKEYGVEGEPFEWSQTSLHHIFEGGWFWILPFDNHADSTNPLCSVGVTVDPRKYPPTKMTPEEEFNSFVERIPSVKKQFEKARPARPWVTTPRLQYSSKRTIGPRYALAAHSAGFLDPLYSRGMAVTMTVLNVLADKLLGALSANDFSEERFAPVERLQQGLMTHTDELIHGSFASWVDNDLWTTWIRVWLIGGALGAVRFHRAIRALKETGDTSCFTEFERDPYPGLLAPDHEQFKNVFEQAVHIMDAVDNKTLSPQDARTQLAAHIDTIELRGRSGKRINW